MYSTWNRSGTTGKVDARRGYPEYPSPLQRRERVLAHLGHVRAALALQRHAPREESGDHDGSEHRLVEEDLDRERGEVLRQRRACSHGKPLGQRGVPEVLGGAVEDEVVCALPAGAGKVVAGVGGGGGLGALAGGGGAFERLVMVWARRSPTTPRPAQV